MTNEGPVRQSISTPVLVVDGPPATFSKGICCDAVGMTTYHAIACWDFCFEISERSRTASPFWAGCPAIFVRLTSAMIAAFGGWARLSR